MAKDLGRTLLLKIGDGATPTEVFTTLAGITSKGIDFEADTIDVTTPDSTAPGGRMDQELLCGTQRMRVSGSGVAENEATYTRLMTVLRSATRKCNFQIVDPGDGTYEGAFFVTGSITGEDISGGKTFNITLLSSGAYTFT